MATDEQIREYVSRKLDEEKEEKNKWIYGNNKKGEQGESEEVKQILDKQMNVIELLFLLIFCVGIFKSGGIEYIIIAFIYAVIVNC